MPFERDVTDHDTIHFTRPIHDLAVRRVHVNPQKVKRDMLPARKSVASRITHRRWTGGKGL
jgi:hypothetical protein